MAQDTAGVDAMVAAADRAGRLLTCYPPRRLDPDFLAIRDAMRSGRLGDLLLVRRTIHEFSRRRDWQMLRKFDGGALSNTRCSTCWTRCCSSPAHERSST